MKARSKTKGKVLISSAFVYDTLFDLSHPIANQIVVKNGKLGKQNLMFDALEKKVSFGGIAGDIAYGLSLLGTRSIVISAVGRDFADYAKHMKRPGIETRLLVDRNSYTATFYGMTDPNREQIGVFQGNAYYKHIDSLSPHKLLRKSDWKDIELGIFSPGTADNIVQGLKEFKTVLKGKTTIFDPGQMLMIDFTKEHLTEAFRHSDIAIMNDTEFFQLRDRFGFTLEKIFALGTKYVIETCGADGSTLHEPHERTDVKAVKVKKVVDPTGAGDAYRAGLIHGILSGKSLEESMKIGAKLGALCVQSAGGQTYRM